MAGDGWCRDGWITVTNWDRFQHYKDRQPVWIKLYLELLDKDEFVALNASDRGVLMTVWLLYARHKGPFSMQKVRSNARTRSVQRAVERLSDAGFIEVFASKLLAQRREDLKREEKTYGHELAPSLLVERAADRLGRLE